MLIEVVLVVVVVVLVVVHFTKNPPGLPPGPRRIPFIGSVSQCNSLKDCKRLQELYGNTFSVQAGCLTIVSMCDYKTIRSAFSRYEFTDRPLLKFVNFLSEGKEAGVIFRNGTPWQTLRRFLLRNLRDLGMGKSRLSQVIEKEAEVLVRNFADHTNKATFFPPSINIAVLNVIWQLVASKRYEVNDEEIIKFSKLIQKFQEDAKFLILQDIFPFLNYLPRFVIKKLCREDFMITSVKIARDMMECIINEHKDKLDTENPKDIIDEFLVEIERQKHDPDSVFNESDLIKTIFDLFAAGTDTTSNMLRWVILYMAKYTTVQQMVQDELDQVIPRGTVPSYLHRQRLPYLDATLHEILRMSSLVGAGVLHSAVHDTYIDNYFIPKGTAVTGYAWFCHFDTKYWKQPDKFLPDRFLDESGKLRVPKEGYLPFGVGKRSCLGEALAKMELFVFSAALLQHYSFSVADGRALDFTSRPVPNTNFPRDQEIMITSRTRRD